MNTAIDVNRVSEVCALRETDSVGNFSALLVLAEQVIAYAMQEIGWNYELGCRVGVDLSTAEQCQYCFDVSRIVIKCTLYWSSF